MKHHKRQRKGTRKGKPNKLVPREAIIIARKIGLIERIAKEIESLDPTQHRQALIIDHFKPLIAWIKAGLPTIYDVRDTLLDVHRARKYVKNRSDWLATFVVATSLRSWNEQNLTRGQQCLQMRDLGFPEFVEMPMTSMVDIWGSDDRLVSAFL